MTAYNKIRSLLEKLPHKIQVSFALYCAEDVYPLVKDNKKAKLCIDLVKEWLRNPDIVELMEKLRDADTAAYASNAAAYHAADDAAYITAYAANAVYAAASAAASAAHSTHDDAHAANAAYTILAANAAAYAARAAAYAANAASHEEKTQEYYGVLVGYLTEVEKELYSQEEK
jgi:hypothetical protein